MAAFAELTSVASRQNDEEAAAKHPEPPANAIETVGEPAHVTPLPHLGEDETYIDCPFCMQRTKTRVVHADSSATTLVNLALVAAGALC